VLQPGEARCRRVGSGRSHQQRRATVSMMRHARVDKLAVVPENFGLLCRHTSVLIAATQSATSLRQASLGFQSRLLLKPGSTDYTPLIAVACSDVFIQHLSRFRAEVMHQFVRKLAERRML